MISKIVFDAFKTDRINWFKENGCSVDSITSNPYEERLSFYIYSPIRQYPLDKISTEVYTLDFNRSNHYGIRLPYQHVKAYMHIMRWGHLARSYRVVYTNIKICEETPFTFNDLAIHFKPYSIKDCAYSFEQFLQWDYHSVVSIRDIDTKHNLITFGIDADLELITNYFTVVNLPSTPNLEFTFKRIDKIKQRGDENRLTCTYQLVNVRTTIFYEVRDIPYAEKEKFDATYMGTWKCDYVKDPTKVTVKVGNYTYDVVDYTKESEHVKSFDLRETGNDADPVNHPNHYEMVGPFESFDIIVESLGIDGARQFCQGNIIKYQTRYKEKNGEEDLKKRHWYSRMDQMLAKCKTIEDYYKLKESDF